MAVPYMAYQTDREDLNGVHRRMSQDQITEYWQRKNTRSIDGFPTGMATAVDT
ncbi:hypothetical protein ACFSC4_18300 [Deinococcus malanensis]